MLFRQLSAKHWANFETKKVTSPATFSQRYALSTRRNKCRAAGFCVAIKTDECGADRGWIDFRTITFEIHDLNSNARRCLLDGSNRNDSSPFVECANRDWYLARFLRLTNATVEGGGMKKLAESRELSDDDQQTFHELYLTYHHRVYSICHRMTQNVSEAEDLTQDVFVQLFRTIGNFRGVSTFSTWLHRLRQSGIDALPKTESAAGTDD